MSKIECTKIFGTCKNHKNPLFWLICQQICFKGALIILWACFSACCITLCLSTEHFTVPKSRNLLHIMSIWIYWLWKKEYFLQTFSTLQRNIFWYLFFVFNQINYYTTNFSSDFFWNSINNINNQNQNKLLNI